MLKVNYNYVTGHGISLGTIPKNLDFIIIKEEGFKTWFSTNRPLTEEELKYYDIRKA